MKARSKSGRNNKPRAKKKARPHRQEEAPQYLFVYGSLKRGGKEHYRLSQENDALFKSMERIQAGLYSIPGKDFAGAVHTSDPERFVKGELFVLRHPQELLRELDEYEGVAEGLFRRELVDVLARGRRFKAWVYLYARAVDEANRIPAGVYSSH